MFGKILLGAFAGFVSAAEVTSPAPTAMACVQPHSVGQCGQCQSGDQCASGSYCCPFMKKCVTSGSDPCYYPIAQCSPMCYDSMNQETCTCSNADYPNNWAGVTCGSPSPSPTPTPTPSQPCVAKNSVPMCGKCQTSNECQSQTSGGYCCPYMKKCVQTSSTGCYYPIAGCNPMCYDQYNQQNCNCSNPDYPNNWVGAACN